MVRFFFDGWQPIARIVVVGTLGYIALVALLRVSGKRTLAQLSSFDFIITVALGASFGRILTARTVPLAEAPHHDRPGPRVRGRRLRQPQV